MRITSPQNPRIKAARALHRGQERRRQERVLIEGARFISEAIGAGAHIETCFYREGDLPDLDRQVVSCLTEKNVELIAVTAPVLNSLAETATPQALVALAASPPEAGPGLLSQRDMIMIADGICDPGNLGSMLRTAAAAGAGMILMTGTVDRTSPKVVRGSAGACYAVPTWTNAAFSQVWSSLQASGFQTVVCDMSGQRAYYQASLRGPVAVVIGNEGHGVSSAWQGNGAECVHIPMPGRAESLNAAVAAAVVLFEAVRQRRGGC